MALQIAVDIVIHEGAAVAIHGGFLEHDFIRNPAGTKSGILLGNTLFHVALGIAYLQQPLIEGVIVLIGVDHGMRFGTLRKKVHFTHRRHRLSAPWGESCCQ